MPVVVTVVVTIVMVIGMVRPVVGTPVVIARRRPA
jgi:hypothetical protein